jgi:hypothetical protein
MGESFGGRRSMGKPRGRWKDAFRRDAISLLHVRNWKATERKRHGWRKEIGEAMARKRVESPVGGGGGRRRMKKKMVSQLLLVFQQRGELNVM